ncbi:hypothetical protein GCM10023172_23510 [Hymenobacter ginsengisoli]|uniref:Uncharacterized protein n=1 Tax=Hymenobacter ginsengisoli TaxID=1051626 RepID=A0ABP8QGV0_9BACT
MVELAALREKALQLPLVGKVEGMALGAGGQRLQRGVDTGLAARNNKYLCAFGSGSLGGSQPDAGAAA